MDGQLIPIIRGSSLDGGGGLKIFARGSGSGLRILRAQSSTHSIFFAAVLQLHAQNPASNRGEPMPKLLMVTVREWKLIAPLLPPTVGRPGKPRQSDRRYVSAFFCAEACR